MPFVNGTTTVLPAPEDSLVNVKNPHRDGVPDVYWVAGVGSVLSFLLMVQRFYTKLFLDRRLQLEDWILLFSWVTSIATVVLCTFMFADGAGGVHAWEMSIDKYQTFMTLVYAAAPIYLLSGSSAKISLLVFYKRIFPQTWLQWSVRALSGVIVAYTAGIFFPLIFACNPIAKSWDPKITKGACIDGALLYIATAIANIISDVLLLALPIQPLINLQMPIRQKIGLVAMFTVGSLTVVTSVVRFFLILKMLGNPDQSWAISRPSLWIIVEANLLIICAAFPTLRKFIRYVAPRILGESTNGRRAANGCVVTIGGTNSTPRHGNQFELHVLERSSPAEVISDKRPWDNNSNSSQTAIMRNEAP